MTYIDLSRAKQFVFPEGLVVIYPIVHLGLRRRRSVEREGLIPITNNQ